VRSAECGFGFATCRDYCRKEAQMPQQSFVAAFRQSAANIVFELRLSAESRYVCKTFCVFCVFLRLFIFP
jgi:hypothetical protein